MRSKIQISNAKMNNNQIEKINLFLKSDEKNLLINKINEHIYLFYTDVFKYYANQLNFEISSEDSIKLNDSLFDIKTLKIFSESSIKKIELLLASNEKKIIFIDYKNYKKLNSKYSSINAYQYGNDMSYLLNNEFKIKNKDLLDNCKNSPAYFFSEISKFKINMGAYDKMTKDIEYADHILKIRKKIFELKKEKKDIINLFNSVKDEVKYKKFNFLIY